MVRQCDLRLPEFSKGFHLITDRIEACIRTRLGDLPECGLLHLFILHTSAGLAISENADPSVRRDLRDGFDRLAPEDAPYVHDQEGPDDMPAHLKSVITGSSLTIPITQGRLRLGTWQGIYLCEFRTDPHVRDVVLTLYA